MNHVIAVVIKDTIQKHCDYITVNQKKQEINSNKLRSVDVSSQFSQRLESLDMFVFSFDVRQAF